MGNIGGPELILIILVVFIFFGAKKIPEMAKGLVREFVSSVKQHGISRKKLKRKQRNLTRRTIQSRKLNY